MIEPSSFLHCMELQLQKRKDQEEMGMESHLTYHYVKITHERVRMFARVCNIVYYLFLLFSSLPSCSIRTHTQSFSSSVAVIIGRLNWIVADVWIVHEMKDLLLILFSLLPNINKHFWVFFFHFICFMLGYTPIFSSFIACYYVQQNVMYCYCCGSWFFTRSEKKLNILNGK